MALRLQRAFQSIYSQEARKIYDYKRKIIIIELFGFKIAFISITSNLDHEAYDCYYLNSHISGTYVNISTIFSDIES